MTESTSAGDNAHELSEADRLAVEEFIKNIGGIENAKLAIETLSERHEAA